jgi:2-isopropylmalate synthase
MERTTLKTEKYILPARAENAKGKLVGHTAEIGKRYVLVNNENFQRSGLYMMIRSVRGLKSARKHLKDHTHDVDSVMAFIGDRKDLTGLTVEVHLDNQKRIVNSPVSVYVPGGLRHGLRFLRGSGKYINVVLVAGGDYNSVTVQ